MSKRHKKVQKRTAKKKSALKKINQVEEQQRLEVKELKRYQFLLTKETILDILINDLNESPEDCELYFDTMENELGVSFNAMKNKPSAITIEKVDNDDVTYRTHSWYEMFIEKLVHKYGEEDARKQAWGIQTGFMTTMLSAKEIVSELHSD